MRIDTEWKDERSRTKTLRKKGLPFAREEKNAGIYIQQLLLLLCRREIKIKINKFRFKWINFHSRFWVVCFGGGFDVGGIKCRGSSLPWATFYLFYPTWSRNKMSSQSAFLECTEIPVLFLHPSPCSSASLQPVSFQFDLIFLGKHEHKRRVWYSYEAINGSRSMLDDGIDSASTSCDCLLFANRAH